MSAKGLYESFSGALARRFSRTGLRYRGKWLTEREAVFIDIPADLAIVGHVEKIVYTTVRDGVSTLATHAFAPGSRPYLGAGQGSRQVFLLGGRYRFTDRGIVDLDTNGNPIVYDERAGTVKPLK